MSDKELEDMSLEEKVQDFEKVNNDKDFSTALEYFFARKEYYIGADGSMDDIDDYYSAILYGQAGNFTVEKVYAVTNENLNELFRNLYIKGGRVATVGSSGDQAILSLFNGAKEVDLIDGNILTEPFVELKIAAIKNLRYDEFLNFLESLVKPSKNEIINYYSKISHSLSGKAKDFWDTLVLEDRVDNFYDFIHCLSDVINVYPSGYMYNQLQEFLNKNEYKINYIISELEDFDKKLKGKYDLILLSNIFDYYSGMMSEKNPEIFLTVVRNLFKNHLAEGGSMQVSSRHEGFALLSLSKKLKAIRRSIPRAGIGTFDTYHTSVMYGKKGKTLYDKMKEEMYK